VKFPRATRQTGRIARFVTRTGNTYLSQLEFNLFATIAARATSMPCGASDRGSLTGAIAAQPSWLLSTFQRTCSRGPACQISGLRLRTSGDAIQQFAKQVPFS